MAPGPGPTHRPTFPRGENERTGCEDARRRSRCLPRSGVTSTRPALQDGMARDKHRIRFRKSGTLRLVSHHDLKRCFERMLRRAALPFASTEGFHPQPRLVFGLSLALGIVGHDEAADLLLTEEVPAEEVHARLARQAPPGLEILRVERVDPKARILARLATYCLPL